MISQNEAIIVATVKIAELMGIEYTKEHILNATQSYPVGEENEIYFEYFLGFDGDDEKDLWTVFAWVSVNKETQEVAFLDYKTPDGKRMENPIKPVRRA